MTIFIEFFLMNGEFCVLFVSVAGNVAAGIAIGVGGFAAGIGMVAFAEAQVCRGSLACQLLYSTPFDNS